MPRGKYVNHKGRSRHFTSPEELQQESDDESEQSSSEEEEDEDDNVAGTSTSGKTKSDQSVRKSKPARTAANKQKNSSDEDDSDEDSDESEGEERGARKGVASLIEIENPNRTTKKTSQKLAQIKLDDLDKGGNKPELTRREREQIEKQKAHQRYIKLHAAGKTREAKADLARLALIRHQREEAAAKREAEKKAAAESKKPTTK